MKKLNLIQIKSLSIIIVAIILISISVFGLILQKNTEPNLPDSNNYNSNDLTSQGTEEKLTITKDFYEVKSVNGEITVFKNGSEFSVMLESVKVNSLPQNDKELIEKGLEFSSYKELLNFLQNYE